MGILQLNPNVRLVVRKLGEVTGKFRTRDLQVLVGSGGMGTVHREFLLQLPSRRVFGVFQPETFSRKTSGCGIGKGE